MFDPTILSGFHTWLSLIALATGFVVLYGLILAQDFPRWTAAFLATAFGTSATGFLFPLTSILPSHVVGALALVVLAVALLARYRFHLAGTWRWIYAVTASISLYFLVFVAVSQAFLKIPALHALAPTLSEVPFAVTQVLVLLLFTGVTFAASRTFRLAVPEAFA